MNHNSKRSRRNLIRMGIAILGITFLSAPLPAPSHVVHPNSIQPPGKLTLEIAARLVRGYLADYPPAIRLVLGKTVGAYPPGYYSDLERAGFLHRSRGKDPGPVFDLTEKAKRGAYLGFVTGVHLKDDSSVLDIPVGEFQYVSGSASLSEGDLIPGQPEVTFKIRFRGNSNARDLLQLGRAQDWTVQRYNIPQITLAQVGQVVEQTFPLAQCRMDWYVRLPHRSCP